VNHRLLKTRCTKRLLKLITIVTLLCLTLTSITTSCSAIDSRATYIERLNDWTKTINVIVSGFRIEDYKNTNYSKAQVEQELQQLEPHLARIDNEIRDTSPFSGLEDMHNQLKNISENIMKYMSKVLELCAEGGKAPLFHQKVPDEPYSIEVENIFTEYDQLIKDIREYKDYVSELGAAIP